MKLQRVVKRHRDKGRVCVCGERQSSRTKTQNHVALKGRNAQAAVPKAARGQPGLTEAGQPRRPASAVSSPDPKSYSLVELMREAAV